MLENHWLLTKLKHLLFLNLDFSLPPQLNLITHPQKAFHDLHASVPFPTGHMCLVYTVFAI